MKDGLVIGLLSVVPRRRFSRLMGWGSRRRLPRLAMRALLKAYVRHYGVDLAEVERELGEFPSLAEFFTRGNYGMVIGNFELDMNDGEMRYKVSVDAEGIELSPTFLKNLSYTAVVTMDRYLPGIMKVLYSDIDPAEAVREIEGG